MLPLILINGLIDSVNPCAIGVLLLYIAILLGLNVSRRFILTFGGFYIFATYVTYFLIGLGILHVVHLFGVHNFFGWVAAALVLFLGAYTLKDYFAPTFVIPGVSRILSVCRVPKWDREITITSALALGVLVGLCEFPCSGGIYLATVALLSLRETFLTGFAYLLLYNLMFVLPLVVIFLFSTNKAVLEKIRNWQGVGGAKTKLIMGITMVVMGALLLFWLIIERI